MHIFSENMLIIAQTNQRDKSKMLATINMLNKVDDAFVFLLKKTKNPTQDFESLSIMRKMFLNSPVSLHCIVNSQTCELLTAA